MGCLNFGSDTTTTHDFRSKILGASWGSFLPVKKIIDGFLQRIVFSKRPNLQRNNPEKNNYPPSKATPDPIILSYSLCYHGVECLLYSPASCLVMMSTILRLAGSTIRILSPVTLTNLKSLNSRPI